MRSLPYLYVATLGVFVLLVDMGVLADFNYWLHEAPHADKLTHFLIAGSVTIAAIVVLVRRWPTRPGLAIAAGTLSVAALTTAEEFSNLLTPYRGWSAEDIAANCLGVACLGLAPAAAWLIARTLAERRSVAS